MKFREFICREALVADLKATNTQEVLEEMVDSMVAAGKLASRQKKAVIDALMDREKKASTGFGNGVAIPHVKHPGAKELVGLVARSAKGVDFDALDRESVFVFFLLISPPDCPAEHLKAMENIFRSAQKEHWRRFLKQAETADALWDLLMEADEESIV
jgi:PTS system fructose-specific IIA component/PTS system nitrogen regulatory IIA component